jgi:diguanylate cyclase (GGDEF)-like protein
MGWTLFPADARQTLRLKRFFMAALSYLLWLSLTVYCYSLDLVDVTPTEFWLAVGAVLACNLLFFALLRSGLNLHWPDPSLTLPQMLVATFWVMLLTALAPKVRDIVLLLYVVVFLFGVFRLRRREYLALTSLVLAAYALVVLRDFYRSDLTIPVSLQALQYAALTVTLVWLAFFGSYVGRLRETVSRRNAELAEALHKNRELAIHDDLTGAYNRRHIIHLLEQEQLRAQRSGRGFCLCLMDLDHFKDINDRHGHLAGDDVLRQFTDRVRSEVRLLDLVARDGVDTEGEESFGRYGGEEFLLVLPETDLEGARVCVERIRQRVADAVFRVGGTTVKISVSCGLTACRPGEDMRAALGRADQALYRAKDRGRNRVEGETT